MILKDASEKFEASFLVQNCKTESIPFGPASSLMGKPDTHILSSLSFLSGRVFDSAVIFN